VVQRVATALGLPILPAIYRSPRPGCRLFPAQPPVLVVGEELFAAHTLGQLTARIAPALLQLHTGHLLSTCLDPSGLRWVVGCVLAFLRGTRAGSEQTPERPVLEALALGLDEEARTRLAALEPRLAQAPARHEVEPHLQGLRLTSARLSLLLSEDLPAVLDLFSDAQARTQVSAFAVSEALARLRRELGMAFALHDEDEARDGAH
jgi:hypothetical protein